ncbi:prolyl oligopeptidase family serine peptidase [Paenibacillus sp. SYP-B3998]|uniref:Prolyl oligopeptidase family serine peptidase n=1 Tax=Paenibacillus sp. SYP-B3998 TaxID=2678564 RepID=A0A6G3ZST8_9BACL|nr:alpha/beta fold hydrolase [Paenibacillus sp. SYP-B3998]NEW04651.1 prolyl oligopeptidase family serine peptidase [Paenibacillus sp. SYP-B3998]
MIKQVFFLSFICFILISCSSNRATLENDNSQSFERSRTGFHTKLIKNEPAPQEYSKDLPPRGVSEIKYKSGDLELRAWISELPNNGEQHPAVVYVHGGFSFGTEDWKNAKRFQDAGYIVLTPMLRGENGNPGSFELFFGEVDDVISAGNLLLSFKDVDPKRIFLAGHSSGGTISMLVSMLPSTYRAIATYGAAPDQERFLKSGWDKVAPFDAKDVTEVAMRSPNKFIQSIQKQLIVYVGKKDTDHLKENNNFVQTAKQNGESCDFTLIEGDHFTSLDKSILDSIDKFNKMQ